ncbi:MAG: FtsX-like permease family protein, partial [Nocardioides sp.]
MSRASLGARSRRGPLLTLAAMSAVVTAGAVTVLGFSAAAGTSPWLVLPLWVIGALAVPAAGHELAVARREEIGLARLRGVHGVGLLRFLLGEPLVAILLGSAAGVALGVGGTWLTTWRWLPEPTVVLTGGTWPTVAGVVVVGLAGVFGGMAAARSEPLSDQVSIATRTRPASTAATFGSVLILVVAAIAVYRSGRGTDPDWVVLVGPALVGLAAGQLTVWMLRVVARVATARTAGSRLPTFLATRRVGRTSDSGGVLRLLVAAGAVATPAATAAAGVSSWSAESARLVAGAPLRVSFDTTAQSVLPLTEQYDPEGRWLMGAVLVDDASAERRRAYVDTARFASVVGGFYDGTDAAGVGGRVVELVAERPRLATGDLLDVTAEPFDSRVPDTPPAATAAVQVTLEYVAADGSPGTAVLLLVASPDDGPVGASAPLEKCPQGCVARSLFVETGVEFDGEFFVIGDTRFDEVDGRRSTTFTGLRFGDLDLVAEDWQLAASPDRPADETGVVESTASGLVVTTALDGTSRAESGTAAQTVPVLSTPGLTWDENGPQVDTPGGDERAADVRGELPALPLVGGAGLLGDLRTGLYASGPTVPAAEVMVLAAADTPADVLDALLAEGGTISTLDEVEAVGARESGAVSARMYALMAACCLLVALLALLAAGARQRAAYRRDVAALRVLGVPVAQIRSAGLGELAPLTVIAVATRVGGGLAAARLLLTALPLVPMPK